MPKSTPASPISQRNTAEPVAFPGDYETFIATLPAWKNTAADFDLQHLWERAKGNARLARILEERRDELSSVLEQLCSDLEAKGLTFADIVAFERQERGLSPFRDEAEYTLPPEHRRA